MTTIEGVPVTTPETDPIEQGEVKTVPVDQDVVVEDIDAPLEPPTPKRKPGRPAGSKSKVPGKPRAPRQKRVVVEEVPDATPEEEVERILPGSRPIPTHGYDSRTVMMLEMLRLQADERKNRKAALYKSWFT